LAKPSCSFEMVNDLHGDLCNLAWTIQHETEGPRLYRRLRRVLVSEQAFASAKANAFWPVAESLEQVTHQTAERAFHYFVLAWQGRSGVIGLTDCHDHFTVRYNCNGGNQATRFVSAVESIPAWRRRLRSVTILRRDGVELIERLQDDKGQSIYVDPPYIVKRGRYVHDFTEAQHGQLASLLARFERTRVVVSYYAHPQLNTLYPPERWTHIDCSRAKHLSVQGQRGAKSATAPEVLIVNSVAAPLFQECPHAAPQGTDGH
jgi:site-specific DNA-adenine methylase